MIQFVPKRLNKTFVSLYFKYLGNVSYSNAQNKVQIKNILRKSPAII